ncbi:MAG: 50S ribosomal protein L11 methyltransferase [Methylacidiphilales bacterium]|nr:50S ribosomal protein L11 methyltransferase [Candidatus Methylacidiphilales bacterium]
MSLRNAWRRWIVPGRQELWLERLQAAGCASWAMTERPLGSRILLEAYLESRAAAVALRRQWGGRVCAVDAREWIKARPAPPTRIGHRLEIVHDKAPSRKAPACPRLHIPHGVAFGSGEHATTFMLLRALARHDNWNKAAGQNVTVLDLGTGSGVLALAARLLGAKKIVATDFDPEAIRTARQNEALNFSRPMIGWRRADVRKLRAKARYDLVMANLFSGILVEAAPQIAGSVSPGGQLWLSGILKSQQDEVAAVYRGQGLRLIRAVRRGKWVMLLLRRSIRQGER